MDFSMCRKLTAVFPEPVPPLIRNASLASIMRTISCAAPGDKEPEVTQSSSEKLRAARE
jgi:hypothetical protein